ncbi:MAG TPA: hypothetical protein VFB77_04330 [Acidimicrobiales bacterium]|nr:hypothetical protein [Acidimicrobiales bacterium]
MTSAAAGSPAGIPSRTTAFGSDATIATSLEPPVRSPIDITTEGNTVVLAVVRCLDEAAGGALLDAASAALDSQPTRIDVDLRALDSFTDAGARALVGCRDLGAKLPGGLHYRTGRGPGRDALLAAYTDHDASPL